MIRLLILLMALNALFTPVNIASACAPDNARSSQSEQSSYVDMSVDHQMSADQAVMHCENCNAMSPEDMANMTCDSACGVSCLVSPVAMTSATFVISVAYRFPQPVSGFINYYTRSISPELRPPLV